MKSRHVSSKARGQLRLRYQSLNPFKLKREIDDTLAQILNITRYVAL